MEVSQSFSQPLQRLAEDALRRFTRVRRLTEDSRKNPDHAAASRLVSDVEAREPRDSAGMRIAEQGLLHGVAH
jgi:hypothetical protein